MLGGPSRPGLSRLAGAPGSRRRLSVLDQAETSSENKSEPSYDNHRSTTTIIGPVTNPSPATLVQEWPRNGGDSSENLAWGLALWPCVQRTNEPTLKQGVLECWRKSCAAVVFFERLIKAIKSQDVECSWLCWRDPNRQVYCTCSLRCHTLPLSLHHDITVRLLYHSFLWDEIVNDF